MHTQSAPSRRANFCLLIAGGAALIVLNAGLIRWAVRPMFIALRDLFEAGHQQGFDQGWNERGEQPLRPVSILDDYRAESS